MIWLLIFVLSYLVGSIPSGYLVARSKGIDIRQRGSSNIGAANVARVMGKKWGYLVGFCDFLKGFLAVNLGLIAAHFPLSPVLGGVAAAIACILGHHYPIWLGFKGGKGTATSGVRFGWGGLGRSLSHQPIHLVGLDRCGCGPAYCRTLDCR